MGRIPNFTNTIFPTASIPMLNLTSTLGLVLFLFIVGLEIDVRLMKRNAKASAMISIVGLIIPLGLGAAVAVPIYNEFASPNINFGYFVLFGAVAVGITAFPVRILLNHPYIRLTQPIYRSYAESCPSSSSLTLLLALSYSLQVLETTSWDGFCSPWLLLWLTLPTALLRYMSS